MKLTRSYYLNPDVVHLAQDLIGKVLYTNKNGIITSAIITETEAYAGETDKASHAYGGRRTKRTEVMYKIGGTSYVYLCYGMYQLFNVVTNVEGIPHAVLVRAVYPYINQQEILKRRKAEKWHKNLLNGPGKLTIGLGIDASFNNQDLLGDKIWIEEHNINIPKEHIKITPRIGIDYAQEHAKLPYRFVFENYKLLNDLLNK